MQQLRRPIVQYFNHYPAYRPDGTRRTIPITYEVKPTAPAFGLTEQELLDEVVMTFRDVVIRTIMDYVPVRKKFV
jgi:hypothetical protein